MGKTIVQVGRMLRARGSVPPVTLTKSDLCASLVDGSELLGETNIDARETKP